MGWERSRLLHELWERAWRNPSLPPLVWAAVILIGSSIPIPPAPESLAWFNFFGHLDKVGHFSEYFIFALLLGTKYIIIELPPKTAMRQVMLTVFAFALMDEVHQRWIPGRFPEALDYVVDITGAFLGSMILLKDKKRHA